MTVSQSRPLRIGTRGSPLALYQANETRDRLRAAHGLPEEAVEIHVIKTSGDRIQDRALAEAGGKGLFTKEIEEALLDGSIDLAVHSSKDMPTVLPDGLALTAFLPREDVRDAIIAPTPGGIAGLAPGAVVGSASLRRQALLLKMRPDLKVELIRGNVDTRIRKVEEGAFAATLLALAGLKRLGLERHASAVLEIDVFPPAVGQGAICIESRSDDAETRRLLAAIDHRDTHIALTAERAFLGVLDGSCKTPIAGHARLVDGAVAFRGMILRPDGSESHETSRHVAIADAAAAGADAGAELKGRAGPGFFHA
jgi:hydroxymethylbilane synthase